MAATSTVAAARPDQFAVGLHESRGGWFIQCSGVSANLNVWHHIAITRDSSNTARIFIDGVLRGTAIGTPAPTTTGGGAFNIGDAGDAGDAILPRGIDEVRISSVAPPATFTLQTIPFTPDASMTFLYHLDEGTGQVLTDASGNNRNGVFSTSSAAESADPQWSTDAIQRSTASHRGASDHDTADQSDRDGGRNASFTATVTGTPTPTLQWQVSTNGGGSFSNLANGAPL